MLAQLAPAPAGYQYIRIGDRILIMSIASRVITADIIDLRHFRAPAQALVVPTEVYETGSCPPGLAKKHNGCLPPGHAK